MENDLRSQIQAYYFGLVRWKKTIFIESFLLRLAHEDGDLVIPHSRRSFHDAISGKRCSARVAKALLKVYASGGPMLSHRWKEIITTKPRKGKP
jgi:hypothetical protein